MGAGGAKNTWVKVGGHKKRKRKKFIPRFAEMGHILKLHSETLEKLKEKRCELESDLLAYDEEFDTQTVMEDIFGYEIVFRILTEDTGYLKEGVDVYAGNERMLLETFIGIIEEEKAIKEIKKEMVIRRNRTLALR